MAKDNGLLWSKSQNEGDGVQNGVIEVVQGMVEEIDKNVEIQPHSIDVLLSEWMGYCLLYETMLSSVLYARDRWLRPGGAILPDTATIVSFYPYALFFFFWVELFLIVAFIHNSYAFSSCMLQGLGKVVQVFLSGKKCVVLTCLLLVRSWSKMLLNFQ